MVGRSLKYFAISIVVVLLSIFLYYAFSGTIILDPILIKIGLLSIRWYGALIATAVYISYFIISKRYSRVFSDNNFDYIFLTVLLSGFIGARIGFALQNTNYFIANPIDLFKIYEGGLSVHGGIIGGVLGLFLITRLLGLNFVKVANIVSPEVLLSIAIGRFGNFFNQEIIGRPTDNIIKMYVEPTNRPSGFENISFYHPVFLYESILLFILYLYLIKNIKRIENNGIIYLLLGYFAIRFIVEFFRIDYRPIFLIFDLAQLVSFGIILSTSAIVITLTFRKNRI